MTVAALYVERSGCYSNLDGVDVWDVSRDAREYSGPHPVIAHPPCQLWGRFSHINFKRWGGEHNRPGNDGGCFASALASVNKYGGVLEHPAFSDAWKMFNLPRPDKHGWVACARYYVCEIWQSVYGHKATKRTWLLYQGKSAPFDLLWDRPVGSHQIGGYDQRGKERNKPTISGRAASATPIKLRDELLRLALHSTRIPKE